MVRINKIYTRTGDQGSTHLCDGSEVAKNSLRICLVGDLDELNSILGIAANYADGISNIKEVISGLQQKLFDFGAELATPPDKLKQLNVSTSEEDVKKLESQIDLITDKVPALKSFVLPGGSLLTAHLHHARTVCRRAERSLVRLFEQEPGPEVQLHYLNRLSDYLFALARYAAHSSQTPEILWDPKREQSDN